MIEPSIEELRRQLKEAEAKKREADLILSELRKRLHDNLCRKSGLIGKFATEEYPRRRSMLVHDITFVNDKPWVLKGLMIRKDGSVGSQEIHMYFDRCFISDGLPSEGTS